MGIFNRKKKQKEAEEGEEKKIIFDKIPAEELAKTGDAPEEHLPEPEEKPAEENRGRSGTYPPKMMRLYPPTAKFPEDEDTEKLLSYFIDKHKQENNAQSMSAVLSSLPPAKFWVPMRLLLHKDDMERLQKANAAGEKFAPQKPVKFAPDVLKDGEGRRFYPVFVLAEDIPEDYKKKFQWAKLESGHCLGTVVRDENLTGLVFNPFTSGLVLPRETLMRIITVQDHKETPKEETEGLYGADS